MRATFHEELEELGQGLVELTGLVGLAMTRATTALLDADISLAERVIQADEEVDQLQHDLENRAVALLARQQPVATDLRKVVTTLRMSADLERSGDLARHVAELVRLRFPGSAIPGDLHPIVQDMGRLAERLMAKAGLVLVTQHVPTALEMESDDDEMDRLLRELFTRLMDDRWPHGVEAAVDSALCGRYYERFADHAVSVAKRLVYLVTGEHVDGLVPQAR